MVHNRNFQVLTTEMFKINRGILSSIIKNIFEPRVEHPYNQRYISQFSIPLVITVFHGTKSFLFTAKDFGSFFQKLLKNIENFKMSIKEPNKFLKNCYLISHAIIFGQRTFFSNIKLVFWGKHEFYLFCYNAIVKDRVLFK